MAGKGQMAGEMSLQRCGKTMLSSNRIPTRGLAYLMLFHHTDWNKADIKRQENKKGKKLFRIYPPPDFLLVDYNISLYS